MTQRDNAPPGLAHTLKQRHLSMIAIAGVIGAGLFDEAGRPLLPLSLLVAGLVLAVAVVRDRRHAAAATPAPQPQDAS